MVLQYKQAAEEQKAHGGIPSFGKASATGSRASGNNPLPPSGSGKTTYSSNTKKPSNPLTKK
jgi:hypothetical protein